MYRFFKSFYGKAGLDVSIIYTILSRIIQCAGGIITLVLITNFLNKNEQGYYYTFASILSIQVFFELGLTGVITQYIAHEAAHLKWVNNYELEGDEYFKSRLASIVQLGIKWIIFISIVLFFVFLFASQYFFHKYNAHLNVNWQSPWLLLSIATCILVVINLFFALLEGLGRVKEVTRLRLIHHLFQLVFIAIFFFIDLKLFANGSALLVATILTSIVLFFSNQLSVLKELWKYKVTSRIDLRKEVAPFLSKIALGNMSGYLIYQLLNPVLFATEGPVLAGQMGATQTALNGILLISLSWFSTKVPLFSSLVAKKRYGELNAYYQSNLLITTVVCTVALLAFLSIVYLLKVYIPGIGNRFLPIILIVFLALTQLASTIGNAQAYFLRSFKMEPFFITSVVIGITSGLVTVFTSKFMGIMEVVIGYFLVNGIVGFIWGCSVFRSKAREWTGINRWI